MQRRNRRLRFGARFSVELLAAFIRGAAALAQAPAAMSSKGLALLIGNGSYPDATLPIASVVKNAWSLAEELRRSDFDVHTKENANRETMRRAVDRLLTKLANCRDSQTGAHRDALDTLTRVNSASDSGGAF